MAFDIDNDLLQKELEDWLEFRAENGMAVPFGGKSDFRRVRLPGSSAATRRAVGFLVSAVTSKVAAANMTNQAAAQQIIAAAEESIATFLDSDDICPRWPHPGPPPWLSIIASELTLVANTLDTGSLQSGILQVAGQVLDRAQALAAGTVGTEIKRAA